MTSTMTPPPPEMPPPPFEPPSGSGANDGPTDDSSAAPRDSQRLTRDTSDRMIAGVASGIARHFGYDPTLVRLAIAAVGVVTFGVAFVGYVVAWIVIPADDGRLIADELRGKAQHHPFRNSRAGMWIGIALFVAGLSTLFDHASFWPGRLVGPFLLIAAGCALLFSGRSNEHDVTAPRTQHSTSSPQRPPSVGASGDFFDSDAVATKTAFQSGSWPGTPAPPRHEHRHSRRKERRMYHRERSTLGRLTLSAVALLVGGAWLIDATHAARVNPAFVAAAALALLGVGILTGAWIGHARGLVWLAIPLAIFCSVAASVAIPWHSGVGQRNYQPQGAGDIRGNYELGVGQLNVDLANLASDKAITIHARIGIGQLQIVVPDRANVVGVARLTAGEIYVFDHTTDGGFHQQATLSSPGTGNTVTLDLRGAIGEVRVVRASSPHRVFPSGAAASQTQTATPTESTQGATR